MKPHSFTEIIGAFTRAPVLSISLSGDVAGPDPLSSEGDTNTQQSVHGPAGPRWAQVKDGAPQGQRHAAAMVMAGKFLSDLSRSLWPTAYWPAMVAWNRKNKPPLPEAELREVAGGILKLEQAKLALAKQEKKEAKAGSEAEGDEPPPLHMLITDENCRPFHDQHNDPYARVLVGEHWETVRVKSRSMKRWLSKLSWDGRGCTVNETEMNATLMHLEALAVHDGALVTLETRITYLPDMNAVLYDLTDPLWRAVRITEKGYAIVTDPGIHFRYFAHQSPQVDPIEGGDLRDLLTLTNLADPDQEMLFLVYLVSCLIPSIPHPVPNLHGPQGSAKTTLAKMARALVDPSSLGALSFPDKARELVQLLFHNYMAFFDNVTQLSQEQSDAICRAVTGEGTAKRQLYTDDDDMIYNFRRCVGFTGINPAARKPDLLDRSILIRLDRIPEEKRREERLVLNDFETMRPRLVGAMFSTLSKAMAIYQTIQLTRLPRMADFCRWGCAIACALGYEKDEFLRVYFANLKEQHEEAIQGSQLAVAVVAFMQKHTSGWKGSATRLLHLLTETAEAEKLDVHARDWPKRSNRLSNMLNEAKTNLLEVGIKFDTGREAGGDRFLALNFSAANASENSDHAVDILSAAQNIFDIPDSRTVIPSTLSKVPAESQGDDSDDGGDHLETSSKN